MRAPLTPANLRLEVFPSSASGCLVADRWLAQRSISWPNRHRAARSCLAITMRTGTTTASLFVTSTTTAAAAGSDTSTTTAAPRSGRSGTTASLSRKSSAQTMAGEAGAAYDVLVIGGGGAGLRAAIAVAEADPRLSVAIVSKVYPMRSHTVSAEGGAAGGHRIRRQPRRARLRHRLRQRLAVRSGRGRGLRRRSAPRSCSSSSTGAAHGAANRTGTSRCGRSAA